MYTAEPMNIYSSIVLCSVYDIRTLVTLLKEHLLYNLVSVYVEICNIGA